MQLTEAEQLKIFVQIVEEEITLTPEQKNVLNHIRCRLEGGATVTANRDLHILLLDCALGQKNLVNTFHTLLNLARGNECIPTGEPLQHRAPWNILRPNHSSTTA